MKSIRTMLAVALALTIVACGDDDTTGADNAQTSANNSTSANGGDPDAGNAGNSSNGGDADAGATNNASADAGNNANNSMLGAPPEFLAEGTARQTPVFVPSDYDPAGSYPLVILLHGYTASGGVQEAYFNLTSVQEEYDFVFLRPDGTRDGAGNRFWNATEFCCDFANTMVDDEGYIVGLIEEAQETMAIDPARVYLVGHSNGGFMSYRLACNHGDKIAAIVSLAGANFTDPDRCESDIPVAVAQAHGTNDTTIAYDGTGQYPSSFNSIVPWAERNGCNGDLNATGETLDLDTAIVGDETSIESYGDCTSEFAVERWTMTSSGHVPGLNATWPTTVLDFLYRHSRP